MLKIFLLFKLKQLIFRWVWQEGKFNSNRRPLDIAEQSWKIIDRVRYSMSYLRGIYITRINHIEYATDACRKGAAFREQSKYSVVPVLPLTRHDIFNDTPPIASTYRLSPRRCLYFSIGRKDVEVKRHVLGKSS